MKHDASRLHDACTLMRGLARVGWALATERGKGSADGARIPRDIDALDASWLTRALQDAFPGVRVDGVERLDRHAGTTARARLRLARHGAGGGPPPPTSVFVKLPPPDLGTTLFGGLMGLGATEVRFYREIAPGLPIDVPCAYHAAIGRNGQRFVLVLEDLAARSVEFTDVSRPVSADRAHAVVGELARLHATFWDSPRLRGDLAWLRRPGANPNLPVERIVCAAGAGRALSRFGELIPQPVRAAVPRIIAARNRLEAAWGRGPLTLIHGDSHVGNLYFPAGGVGFLDWQVAQCGQGMRDAAYFLINSLPTETRRAHERDLVAHYLQALRACGAPGPSFADAWQQYRLHAFYAWIAAAVTAAAVTLQETPIVRAGLARASAAVVDLGALEALAGAE
jgi:aminoglycoside phosphotransferase (APT) family kinase protein